MNTWELLEKCIKKDPEAWDKFIRHYERVVTRSVRYKLKALGARIPGGEYRDIVQEIFMMIWEKDRLLAVKDVKCLDGWLAIVSINYTANYYRKKHFKLSGKMYSLEKDICKDGKTVKLKDLIESDVLNTCDMIRTNELRDRINDEISRLDPKEQLALKLCIFDGKSYKAIARVMGIPRGTVATFIKRAKDTVRSGIGPLLEDNEKNGIFLKEKG